MSCSHSNIAKLVVRFIHTEPEEFELASGGESFIDRELSHIPREGDVVQLPNDFYPYTADVEEVTWNLNDAPPHVIVKVSS